MGVRSAMSRLAREDDEVLGEEVALVPETEAQAPADQAELAEVGGEVESSAEAIEEAGEDIEGLETTQEIVEASVEPEVEGGAEGPGMEPVAAGLAAEAVARIRNKYRLGAAKTSMPALESFGRSSSRKQATRLALLGIGETIKGIWERIKAFFKGLWEKIKLAVKSIFQSNMRTAKRAKALLSALGDTKFNASKPKNDKFKANGVAGAFNLNGKTGFDVAKGIIERHTSTQTIIPKILESAKTATEAVTTSLNQTASAGDKLGAIAAAAKSSFDAYGAFIKATASIIDSGGKKADANAIKGEFKEMMSGWKDTSIVIDGPFISGKYLYFASGFTESKLQFEKEDSASTFKTPVCKLGIHTSEKAAATEVPTLNSSEMRELCNLVSKGTDELANLERQQKLGDNLSNDILKLIDDAIKVAQASIDKFDKGTRDGAILKNALGAYHQISSALISVTSNTSGSLNVMTMSAMNHGLDYVSGSMKQY